jgi:hypothetical protein
MAVAVGRLPQAERHPIDRRAPVVVVRWVAALAATSGVALALFFGVAPIRMSVHEQVGVTQASGEQGTGLTVTDQTRTETRAVTCVPFLRYDSGSNQDRACKARVQGPMLVAGLGLLLFVAGSAGWILSGGDPALGLSGRRPFVRSQRS